MTRVYSNRARIGIAVALALAAGLFVVAYQSSTAGRAGPEPGTTGSEAPFYVEQRIPRPDTEALSQQEIGFDLEPGWEAEFDIQINGTFIDLPFGELRVVPELNAVYYQPGEGKTVESLVGEVCVLAQAWETARGRSVSTRNHAWCFQVL